MKTLLSWRTLADSRRHQYWRAALVGLGAGLVALLFQQALHYAEAFRVETVAAIAARAPVWGWVVWPVVAACACAFAAWLTVRFAPEAGGSGIPHVKGVLMHTHTMRWHRIIPVKFVGALLAIGSGLSLGREGPTVQMGAAVGQCLADILRVPPKAAPRLVACGGGAGLAAAFHAPLAGFIFTIEELQREFSSLTYSMALIAAVVADIVTTSVWGSGTAFDAEGFPAPSLLAVPLCMAAGALAGVAGAGFNKSLLWLDNLVKRRVKVPMWQRAAIAGGLAGLVAWVLPAINGGGHDVAEQLLDRDNAVYLTFDALAILFAGKFLLTLASYAAGVPGGIFAPMLVIGASLGVMCGVAAEMALPEIVPIPQSFAAIGMAAFFAAVVRAPLTGVVLVLQMTGDWNQLLALLAAAMTAYLVSEKLNVHPIYEALLSADLNRQKAEVFMSREPILLEFVVQEGSPMDGKAIRDLPVPERCLFVTIARHGNDLLPRGDTVLERGDHITAVLSGEDPSGNVLRVLAMSKV